MKPRLLDLFCGAGGAAMGYHRAGFEVVGVDIAPQPNYPFEFHHMDALDVLDCVIDGGWGFDGFAAIHASPPCQLFSAYQRANKHQGEHLNLIPPTRHLLRATGLPYVIENVPGAPLENPATTPMSLNVAPNAVRSTSLNEARFAIAAAGPNPSQTRLFETSFPLMTSRCACGGWMEAKYDRGSRDIRPNDRRTVAVGEWRIPLATQHQAMGIDWMTMKELSQAIPPAFTELIGHQLLVHLNHKEANHASQVV
jgi:DNA (cytosine-5)-methyltransferase 1